MPINQDPDTSAGESFSVEEAMRTQQQLRDALGLGPERFPLPAFVGMISDEIEQLRASGRTDHDIAGLIASAIGRSVAPEDLARHFASSDLRHGSGG